MADSGKARGRGRPAAEPTTEFGRVLREARISRGWTMGELAERLGVSTRSVGYWERGPNPISLRHAHRVVRELPELDLRLLAGERSEPPEARPISKHRVSEILDQMESDYFQVVPEFQRPSITPEDQGCLDLIGARLEPLGFTLERMRFGEVENLWATRGTASPRFVFAGHTDVVPTGPEEAWSTPPFTPTFRDGMLHGRGAADMKGSLAAMVQPVKARDASRTSTSV